MLTRVDTDIDIGRVWNGGEVLQRIKDERDLQLSHSLQYLQYLCSKWCRVLRDVCMFIASAPSYRRLLGCTVVIIHMTSFYTEIMYDNESVRLGRGGVLRIVKCGRGLLLTATAASTTELKQIALQVAAKLLVTLKQSDCNTQKKCCT